MNVPNKIQSGPDAWTVFACDAEMGFTPKADSDENGIVFREQFLTSEVFTDIHAGLNLDAEGLHQTDFVEAHAGLHFIISDATGIESPRIRLLFKNNSMVSKLGEFGCTA